MSFLQKTIKGFIDANRGILESFRTQANMRFHYIAAILVTALGVWLQISTTEWILLLLTIGLVISCEQINTALEYLVDLVSPEYHVMAGKIKDLAAGAVLLTAITAAIIGCIIFLPKLLELVQ